MSEDNESSDVGFPFSLDTFDFYQLILTVQFPLVGKLVQWNAL